MLLVSATDGAMSDICSPSLRSQPPRSPLRPRSPSGRTQRSGSAVSRGEDSAETEEGGLDDLLFDESSEEEEEGNTPYGIKMRDLGIFAGDEEKGKIAGVYRQACDRRRTHAIRKVLVNLTREACDVSRVELRVDDLRPLCDVISTLNHIRQMDLSHNSLGPAGGLLLAEGLKGTLRRLSGLNLDNNNIGDKAGLEVCKGFKGMHGLKTLNLARNSLGDEAIVALGEGCNSKCKDMYVDVSYNSFGDVGFGGIAKLVADKVVDLNAEWNNVGVKGTKKLGECAGKECRLKSLNLSSNPLYTAGILPLLSIALSSPFLETLCLSNTSLDPTGGWCAVKTMSLSEGLKMMDLEGNVIGEEAAFLYLAMLRGASNNAAMSPKRSTSISPKSRSRTTRPMTSSADLIKKCTFAYTLTPISADAVYNLEESTVNLDLSDVWDHFKGTYMSSLVRFHRSHRVISCFFDGGSFNLSRSNLLPYEGNLSMALEHGIGRKNETIIGRHEGVKMRLDLSNERDREVGLSQLIKHLEMRIDSGPKNASNAVGLKTNDGGQAMYVSGVKLDGVVVKVGGRGWFKIHKSGILEYTLNEGYLRMNGEVRGRRECEAVIADIRGRKGVFVHSLKIDGKDIGADEFERKVDEKGGWKTKVEIKCPDKAPKETNPLLQEEGEDGEEEKKKKKKEKKSKKGKKNSDDTSEEPKKEQVISASIQLRSPSVVFTSVVTLDLGDLSERASFKTYLQRARNCIGEGMLDMMVDGKNGGNVYEDTWCVPLKGEACFTFVVARCREGRELASGDANQFHTPIIVQGDCGNDVRGRLWMELARGQNSGGKPVISELSVDGTKQEYGTYMNTLYSLPQQGNYSMLVHPCCAVLKGGANKYNWLEAVRTMLSQVGDETARLGVFKRMWKDGVNTGMDGTGGEGRMNLKVEELWSLIGCLEMRSIEGVNICCNEVSNVEDFVESLVKKGWGEGVAKKMEGLRKRELWGVVEDEVARDWEKDGGNKEDDGEIRVAAAAV